MEQRTRVRRTAPAVAVAAAALLALTSCTSLGGVGGVMGEPGASGVRDPYFPRLGNGGYDVQHYTLTLDYAPRPGTVDRARGADRTRRADQGGPAGRLTGTAKITARATQDLSAFNLDLHGLDVSSATVGGAEAAVSRAGNELTLRPDTELSEGETFTAVVRYSGDPATLVDADGSEEGWLTTVDGAVALGQPSGSMAWFPGNNHPSDKASYDITITVPKGLKAVSNGELKSERTRNGRTTFAWHSGEPMASYLATVAIGAYETKTSRTPSGVPVYTAVDPTVAKSSAKVLATVPAVMEWATKAFGPYPFSSTGAIVERGNDSEYALETQTKPVFPGAPDQGLLVHELAHQWFGNSVTPKTWRDMWLNEGFATYAEWLWAEDFEHIPADASFRRAFALPGNWAFPPASPPTAADISDEPVYGRGAMVIHKIREAVGDDAFFDIVRGWTATHRHGNASTDDFTAYVEQKSGRDLEGLWETWLYGKNKPRS
ncbi:M1 family metallopeptidase [Streptomyces agglomeratus]|uniref:M1 family metallopeptidase n=1 Tax=Streptomyces agglomeratus TaxID=285458 RepID=UPI00085490AE|nr:metallopeptidase [Streptomyces agglomeratus]